MESKSLLVQSNNRRTVEAVGVSIVIPAYNEVDGIRPVLDELAEVLAASGLDAEVIVVDDGSQDGTAELLREQSGITLLRHKRNKGYGAALKTGIRHARHELICITDADGTYPNHRIPGLVEHLVQGEYDMVVGARTGEDVNIPLIRRPAKWGIGQMANFVAGGDIPDINSGLRIFRRSVALNFFGILPDGFSFTTTITLGALTNSYLVDYVPINYQRRVGSSKIKPVQDTINFTRLIWRIALYFAPLRIFLPLCLLLLVLAAAWGTFTYYAFGSVADVSTMIIAMAGIQVGVIGLLAELINQRVPNLYHRDRHAERRDGAAQRVY